MSTSFFLYSLKTNNLPEFPRDIFAAAVCADVVKVCALVNIDTELLVGRRVGVHVPVLALTPVRTLAKLGTLLAFYFGG